MINSVEVGLNQFIEQNKAKYPSSFFIEKIVPEESATQKLVVLTRAQRIELVEKIGSSLSVESLQESAGDRAVVSDKVLNLYTNPDPNAARLADQLLPGEKIRFLRVTDFPGWVAVSVEHDFPDKAPFEVGWMEEENVQTLNTHALISIKNELENLHAVIDDFQGVPYLLSGKTTKGIDCSGLSQQIIKRTRAITLPRLARWQWLTGVPVDSAALVPGDLAFFTENGDVIHHAGVVVDMQPAKGPTIVHSSLKNGGVKIENLGEVDWLGNESKIRLAGYRRII